MPTVTFTSSTTWTVPSNADPTSVQVVAWGPSGNAVNGGASFGGGGGGGGALGAENALGGLTAGVTVLTVTIGAAGSGNATTVTGGSVTVTGNHGGNASTTTGGAAGAASSNSVTFAGGAGGGAGGGTGGAGGGGGSAGLTGAGGTGGNASGTTGGAGGSAGTGSAGFTGGAGGKGGNVTGGGAVAGTAPGGAGGGGAGGSQADAVGSAGQVTITWSLLPPGNSLEFLPGPTWFHLFKSQFPRPRQVTPPSSWGSVSSTGSFTLAPLHFSAQGSQTSPAPPQINPGTTWLSLFKGWTPRPFPVPPAVQAVTSSGSFSLAPLHFSAQGSQSSPDVPGIAPGSTWLDLFKPFWLKPRPPVPPATPVSPGVSATGSFTLAPLAFSANGAQTSPDVPQILPGTTWFDLFKPGLFRPRPVPPAVQGVNATGSFTLAPFAFTASGSQTSPDIPQINPSPVWFDLFKPGLFKPRPVPPVIPAVNATGSFTLAPLTFAGSSRAPLQDQPQILPGPSWLALFKPWLPKRPQPAPQIPPATTSGSFTLAPLAFSGTGSQSSPDVPQIFPGTTWLDLFKPGVPRLRPVPPVIQGVNATGSFTLAPLAFLAQGAQSSPDIPQVNPGSTWLDLFKPGLPRSRPFLPAVPPLIAPVTSAGSFTLAPLTFTANGSQTSPDQPQIFPGPVWLDLFKPGLPRQRPVSALVPPLPAITSSGHFTLAPFTFSGIGAQGFQFIGHYSVSYPDYADSSTLEMLSCIPGGFYNMYVVSFRAGLVDPPSDGRWRGGAPGIGDEVIFVWGRENAFALARELNADLQAVNAAKPYEQVSGGIPVPPPPPAPVSEASKTTAAAISLNADLQARMARGEKIGE